MWLTNAKYEAPHIKEVFLMVSFFTFIAAGNSYKCVTTLILIISFAVKNVYDADVHLIL